MGTITRLRCPLDAGDRVRRSLTPVRLEARPPRLGGHLLAWHPYDLRRAAVSLWLDVGLPQAEPDLRAIN